MVDNDHKPMHRAIPGIYTPIPPDVILTQHPRGVFKKRPRQGEPSVPINALEDLPLLDRYGFERRIWDHRGRRIHRQVVEEENQRPSGILVDLEKIDDLFRSGDVHQDSRDGRFLETVFKYPYAFIRNSGSVQARRPLPLFQPLLRSINTEIAKPDQHAVYATDVQLYNRSLHFISPRANEHPALHGLTTARFLSAYARTNKDKKTGAKIETAMGNSLPYQRLEIKTTSPHVEPDLRIEQVLVIQANRLAGGKITPKYILIL